MPRTACCFHQPKTSALTVTQRHLSSTAHPRSRHLCALQHKDSVAAPAPATDVQHTPHIAFLFRFWHDEKRFKGTGESSLAQRALLKLGGERVGGEEKASPVPGVLGWQVPDRWDLLWSPSTTATKAANTLHPTQLCSAVPGSRCLTKKKHLSRTLQMAYGSWAFDAITPLTFELPAQLQGWVAHMKHNVAERRGAVLRGQGPVPPPLWILKTSQHLGQGVVICPQREALQQVVARQKAVAAVGQGAGAAAARGPRPFVIAQRYLPDPLLVAGRKFGLRLWALVTSTDPLTVYLHTNGLVLFSNQEYMRSDTTDLGSHLTNYALNTDGDVWGLDRLEAFMGQEAWTRVMHTIRRHTALAFAAGAGHMSSQCQAAGAPPGTVFELFGLDFLLDASGHPWLLEINATPSLAVEHSDPDVEHLILEQKQTMVEDMFRLLRVPSRWTKGRGAEGESQAATAHILAGVPPACHGPATLAHLLRIELELRHAGGWRPLMHLLPTEQEAEHNGWEVSRTTLDEHLRAWLKAREAVMTAESMTAHAA